jgi:shikimate dehydrogenase
MTDRYAVIGNPIAHSKSPLIHTAFAQVTGQDMVYSKVLSPLGEFKQTVDAFRADGGRGMNVTAPFKLDAFAYATDLAPSAQMAGAVNALKFEDINKMHYTKLNQQGRKEDHFDPKMLTK